MRRYFLRIIQLLLLSFIALNCKDEFVNPNLLSEYEIVYKARDGYFYTMNGEGSNKARFFNVGGFSPSFSPDGKKIACVWSDVITQHEFWLVTFDVKDRTMEKIAFIKQFDVFSIDTYSWSPDRYKIVFNRAQNGFVQSDIFVVDVNTKEVNQLTSSLGYCYGPKWSPDQKQIFFVSYEDSMLVGYLMNADGSNIETALNLPKGKVISLNWSPDCSKVIFLGTEKPSTISTPNKYDLYLSDRSGMKIKRLTFDGNYGTGLWSPNGNLILFSKGTEEGADLYIMNSDGSNQRKITNSQKAVLSSYLWSPDGKKIIYIENPGGIDSTGLIMLTIRVVNPDGSNDINTEAPLFFGFDCRKLK